MNVLNPERLREAATICRIVTTRCVGILTPSELKEDDSALESFADLRVGGFRGSWFRRGIE